MTLKSDSLPIWNAIQFMERDENATGVALVGRCAWLGTKISLIVLLPIGVLCWLAIGGVVLYKSASLGVSPVELMRLADAKSPSAESPTHLAMITDGLIASVELVVLGVTLSASTGAAIGAIGALIRRRQRQLRTK